MILLVFLSLASFTGCDKLDRTYLPPPGSKFAGGSPGVILAPDEQPRADQIIEGTTVRPQKSPIFYSPTSTTLGQPAIDPGTRYKTTNVNISPGSTVPGTYNVPTTTTSYAFTQTTTYAPITCLTPDCTIETGSQTQFNGLPNLIQQTSLPGSFPQQVPSNQQSKIRPGISQPGTFVQQQGGSPKIPFQQVTSQYLPSNLPAYRDQGFNKPEGGTVFGTLDGISEQPIRTYSGGKNSQSFPDYIQRPAQENVPQAQADIYSQTNSQNNLNVQMPVDYNLPDKSQNKFQGRTGLPGNKQVTTTPFLFSRVPTDKQQDFISQNISSIADYTTPTPFIERNPNEAIQILSKPQQFPFQPTSGNLNLQTSPSASGSDFASFNYPSSLSPSGYSPTATPKQFDKSVYDSSSQLQPNGKFSGTLQPIIPGSGLTERRPVRPQTEFERNAAILNYENILTPEGFSYSFDTENGIHADESGTALDGVKAQGAFSYTGDDGKLYSIVYSADENGYQPIGDHLPTPPPIPEAILRVIQQSNQDEESGILDDGSYDDNKYGYKKYLGAMDRYTPGKYRQYSPNVASDGKYHPYTSSVSSGGKLVESDYPVEKSEPNYDEGVTSNGDKSYKQTGLVEKSPSKTADNFRPGKYKPAIQSEYTGPASEQGRERFPSDLQKPELGGYNEKRKFIDNSKYTDLRPTRLPDQEQQNFDRTVGPNAVQKNTPEFQYDNGYYRPNLQDGKVQRPSRPEINNNKVIGINSRVTPESFSAGYTPTTFRPITDYMKYRPLKGQDDKELQFSDDQGQTYDDQEGQQKNRLSIKPDFRRPSMQVKNSFNSDGYAYLPPSQRLEPIKSTRLQNEYREQTQFPSTAFSPKPLAGQFEYKFTTLKPFMTPNASPAKSSLDYDSDESFPTTYPTSGPSQAKTYTEKQVTNTPIYKSSLTSEGPLINQDGQTLTGRPTLISDYKPGFNAAEGRYQDYETPDGTERPNQYKQYTIPSKYSQGSPQQTSETPRATITGGRDQNVRLPVDRFSETDFPGQSTQDISSQKADAGGKPQYYPTQAKQTQRQYTRPLGNGEIDTSGQVIEVRNKTPPSRYFPSQSNIQSQKDYSQQPQYMQGVSQTEQLPTTYRPFNEKFVSSSASPDYNITPTKSFGFTRTSPQQQVIQKQVFGSQPTTAVTGGIGIIPVVGATYPSGPQSEQRPGVNYGKDVSRTDVTDRPSIVSTYRQDGERKPGESDGSDTRFGYTKPVSGTTQFQKGGDLKPGVKVEDRTFEQTTITGSDDRFSPSQVVKGETFSGPKQAPRFDSETGYHY